MAAANLVVKMLLDSGAFDTNIKSAQKQLQTFSNVGKSITSTITKLAGGIGLASGAFETFQNIIKGSQTTSDAWDRTMRAAKTTVDNFFTAISTGDFTAFNQGLTDIINRAKEAASAIDQLGNTTMSYGYFTSRYSAEFQTVLQKAKDKTLDQNTRETSKETANQLIGKQEEITEVLVATVDDAMKSLVTETNGLSKSDIGRVNIDDILFIDVAKNRSDMKEQLTAQYADYEKIYNEVVGKHTKSTYMQSSTGGYYQNTVDYEAVKKEMQQYNQQYKQAILYNEILVKKGDDWLQNLIKIVQQSDNAQRNLATMKQAMNEVNSMDMSKGIEVATVKSETPAVEGSLRYINEEIAKVQKELQNLNPELNPQKLQELQNKLAELENKKRKIEYEITYIDKGEKQESVALGKQGLQTDGWLALQKPKTTATTENTNNTADTENKITANEKWAASINGVASALGAVTNMTNEGASAWISWGAGILTSIAAALPALSTLFAAETAVAGATAAKSAAETPVVGWILAGAAVASVLAAIAALPKFANGGIVDSPFGVGDRVLARVNGGEMILNRHQQSNLFNLLNNGGTASTNKVTFEIEGKKLIGVLKNYNNKINKAL